MGKGDAQTRFHLVGVTVLLVGVLMTFVVTTDALRTEVQVTIGQRDWIDDGLDMFYNAIGRSKDPSFFRVTVKQSYTSQERMFFVIGLIVAVIVAVIILFCCFRCASQAVGRSHSPPPPVYIAPPNSNYATTTTYGYGV